MIRMSVPTKLVIGDEYVRFDFLDNSNEVVGCFFNISAPKNITPIIGLRSHHSAIAIFNFFVAEEAMIFNTKCLHSVR